MKTIYLALVELDSDYSIEFSIRNQALIIKVKYCNLVTNIQAEAFSTVSTEYICMGTDHLQYDIIKDLIVEVETAVQKYKEALDKGGD